jgi:hypothetical protein
VKILIGWVPLLLVELVHNSKLIRRMKYIFEFSSGSVVEDSKSDNNRPLPRIGSHRV